MKGKLVLFLVVLGVAGLAAGFLMGVWREDKVRDEEELATSSVPPNLEAQPSPKATAGDGGSTIVEGTPEAEMLSLQEFAKRDFNGRDLKVGQVLAENESYTRYYITYKSGELTISGIMNVPKGTPPAGGFPVLFLNHGHIDTSIYTNGRGLKREQDYLARRGYVVIHSDYRGHADSTDDPNADRELRLGYAEDVINAVKAMQGSSLPYFNKNKVGLLGHSMGGGVSWVVAVTQPKLADAIVLFAPVSADARDNFEKWLSRRREVAEYLLTTYGSPEENPRFWDGVSPRTFFKNIEAPIMIHHGTADESVPLAWSERSEQDLKAAGKDVTMHVYPGEPHEFIDAWPTVMQRTEQFFDQRLTP